jgi:hypothetical protein
VAASTENQPLMLVRHVQIRVQGMDTLFVVAVLGFLILGR